MKFIHLADLHIGKKLNGYSLLEDQEFIFDQILELSREFDPDAFLIAGDVFDRSVPSEKAVNLFDSFIFSLSKLAPVYIISGNHDSGIRLALFNKPLEKSNIFISGDYSGEVDKHQIEINDENVNIFMLPYITPANIKTIHETEPSNYHEALVEVMNNLELNKDEINILLSHQFYLNRHEQLEDILEGSERPIVGGLDDIAVTVLKDFDYVALGHIHGMRNVKDNRIRYSGTPLKYSPNESKKYLNCITLSKDNIKINPIELKPLRDVREIKGHFKDLMNRNNYTEDYVTIDLLDKKSIPNAKSNLLKVFPNLLNIKYNVHRNSLNTEKIDESLIEGNPVELLESFFKIHGQTLDSEEVKIASEIFKELKESQI